MFLQRSYHVAEDRRLISRGLLLQGRGCTFAQLRLMSTREQAVVGGVLVEILARVAPREAKNLSPENLSDQLKRAFPGSMLVRAADVARERVEELPVARFLHLVGCVREFLVGEATPRKGMQQDARQKLISSFTNTANVIRTF